MRKSKCVCSGEAELSLEGLLKGSFQINLLSPCSPGMCRNYCMKVQRSPGALQTMRIR